MAFGQGVERKEFFLGIVLFCLVGVPVNSQQAEDRNFCKWPHNATSPSGPSLHQDACELELGAGLVADLLPPSSSSNQRCSAEQRWEVTREPVAGQYIVRFREYKMAAEHSAALAAGMGSSQHWRFVERQNAAARFPTDFALVQIDLDHAEYVKEQLNRLPIVKDIHPEQRVKRSLVWTSQEECDTHSGSLCDLGPHQHINKRPGRFMTKPSQGLHNNDNEHSGGSRKLMAERSSIVSMFQAELLWNQGFRGELVKMGVFDTGIRLDHPHVKNIRERTNWTHEPTLEDGLGHGTFVAGVIGGTDASCPGFAPEVELYTFRVFTNDQVSYTSWFLDAFNYAIGTEMNVVNLSIGGPDYLDLPFVEKVWEITSSGILMVSAIGNDGPLYGTLNNPADQNDVIGVGGIDYADKIASFSSRGMSTWELPRGYGRAKPDVVAYGRDVMGSRIQGGCRSLSGTSVASPVVAGAVCLLASTVPVGKRWHFSGGILNPASMKQALVEGANPIPGISMYEQGQGKLDLVKSKEILKNYTPRASIVPASLDFRQCPFLWPFCRQPVYAHAMPLMFNATVLNGMGLTGKFEAEPLFVPTDEGGKFLDVRFEHSDLLWPWSGYLGLYIYVRPEGSAFNGTAAGEVSFTIVSPPLPGESKERKSLVKLPITVAIIPTPPRERRVLWDQFHSLRYPPAYLPRDSLDVRNDILDWHGDHPHTNYHDMYDSLRDAGYFLEVLGSPLSCFDASQYGALLIVDSEEEFYEEEIAKLHRDVEQHGLGLIVFAEWYNVDTMVKMRFFDDNTRSWWTPVTGGGNVPAVNDLLGVFGIGFGDALLEGQLSVGEEKIYYASGVNIARFPAGGTVHAAQLADKATVGLARSSGPYGVGGNSQHAVLGFAAHGAGRLAVYGDSNCLDSSHQRSSCFGLLQKAIQYVAEGKKAAELFPQNLVLGAELGSADMVLPTRRADVDMTPFSSVLSHPLTCYPNAPLDFELVTIPHRGASQEKRASAITKIKEQPIITNVLPLNSSANSTSGAADSGSGTQEPSMNAAQGVAGGLSGKAQEKNEAAIESFSPPPPGLKRFLPADEQHQVNQATVRAEAALGASNDASADDAALFLGTDSTQQTASSEAESDASQAGGSQDGHAQLEEPAVSKQEQGNKTESVEGAADVQSAVQAGTVQGAASEAADQVADAQATAQAGTVQQTDQQADQQQQFYEQEQKLNSHLDIIRQVEKRQQQREQHIHAQTDLVQQAKQREAEKQQLQQPNGMDLIQLAEQRQQQKREDAQEQGASAEAANLQTSGQPDSWENGETGGTGASGTVKASQEPAKPTRYDSIDPMGKQEEKPEGTRKEINYLETDGTQWMGSLGGSRPKQDTRLVPTEGAEFGSEDDSVWSRLAGSLGSVPQALAVLGVVGIFILWHVRRKRRAQEGSPLRDRGNSTRVVTLGMLGLGSDSSSMKSRQRQTLERSPTLGR